MRIGLFIKGNSKNITLAENLRTQLLSEGFDVTQEISSKSDTSNQISKLIDTNCDLLIAAGGDGTLHQCVNILMSKNLNNRIKLAHFPTGTANDFAKTIHLDQDVPKFIELIKESQFQKIDIGRIISSPAQKTSYFINIADAGIGGEIIHKVNKGNKKMGTLTYPIQLIKGLLTFKRKHVMIKYDNSNSYSGKLLSLVIANGNYFANGLHIAPHASLNNGKFAITQFGDVTIWDYFKNIKKIKKGLHLQHPEVKYFEAQNIVISCKEKDYHLEADGEYIGQTEAVISVIPNAIDFLI